jgi:hypothetical protein
VPPEDVPDENGHDITFDGNFCMSGMHYTALVRYGTTVKLPLMAALQSLLPIGQRLYLRMDSQSAGPLLRRVRSLLEPERAALRVHLFSPGVAPVPGKVHVACKICRMGSKVALGTVLSVDPWELLIDLGERTLVPRWRSSTSDSCAFYACFFAYLLPIPAGSTRAPLLKGLPAYALSG